MRQTGGKYLVEAPTNIIKTGDKYLVEASDPSFLEVEICWLWNLNYGIMECKYEGECLSFELISAFLDYMLKFDENPEKI